MASKQNNVAYGILNGAMALGLIIGLYFLYVWLKNHVGGSGGTLFGGSGKTESPVPSMDSVPTNVGDKILKGFEKAVIDPPKNLLIATQLSMANKEAVKFDKTSGSTITINKALKAVTDLDDANFVTAVKEWKALDGITDVLNTPLAGSKIYTGTHSKFLTRYTYLFGVSTPSPTPAGKAVAVI